MSLKARLETLERHCGITLDKKLDIGQAIKAMKQGKSVTRGQWRNMDIILDLVYSLNSDILPYIRVKTIQGKYAAWCPNYQDLMAEDYQVVDD